MIGFLCLLACCLSAAYGAAMRKVTLNRRAKAERGQETAGTSKFYDVAGQTLFIGGLVALVAWVAWAGMGNPVDFYNDVFAE